MKVQGCLWGSSKHTHLEVGLKHKLLKVLTHSVLNMAAAFGVLCFGTFCFMPKFWGDSSRWLLKLFTYVSREFSHACLAASWGEAGWLLRVFCLLHLVGLQKSIVHCFRVENSVCITNAITGVVIHFLSMSHLFRLCTACAKFMFVGLVVVMAKSFPVD